MLLADTTFHLEESLSGLQKINSLSTQLAGTSLSATEREEATSQLSQAEGSAPFHTQQGLGNVELIRDFTSTTPSAWVVGEIVDRLAAVSFYND